MSLYMSAHKKKKSFPFAYFGFAAIVSSIILFFYSMGSGVAVYDFINGSLGQRLPVETGIATVVLPFLLCIFGLGVIKELKAGFKAVLYLLHFVFFILLSVSGYFMGNPAFEPMMLVSTAAGLLYFLLLGIYIFVLNKTSSRYRSLVVSILTVIPVIPLAFAFYIEAAEPVSIFTMDLSAFGRLAGSAFLVSLFIYTLSNSIYLEYVNRKAPLR